MFALKDIHYRYNHNEWQYPKSPNRVGTINIYINHGILEYFFQRTTMRTLQQL